MACERAAESAILAASGRAECQRARRGTRVRVVPSLVRRTTSPLLRWKATRLLCPPGARTASVERGLERSIVPETRTSSTYSTACNSMRDPSRLTQPPRKPPPLAARDGAPPPGCGSGVNVDRCPNVSLIVRAMAFTSLCVGATPGTSSSSRGGTGATAAGRAPAQLFRAGRRSRKASTARSAHPLTSVPTTECPAPATDTSCARGSRAASERASSIGVRTSCSPLITSVGMSGG